MIENACFFTIKKRTKFFLFFLFLTLLPALTFSQENDSIAEKAEPAAINTTAVNIFDSAIIEKYKNVDKVVLAMKKRNKKLPILAKEITAPFATDEEKVRAIFVWITNNIAYDCIAYHSKTKPQNNLSYKTPEELIRKLDKYYMEIATLALRNKKAVCDGYSVLFMELCKANNIPCQVVMGRANENKEKIKRIRNRKNFNTNHSWNKVQLNGVWYYVDATWSSGYCDKPVKKFYKKFNPYYYLATMDELYPTHAENVKLTERRNNPIPESDEQ